MYLYCCRYYFALQIKHDLLSGQLTCNANTAAMLSAYIVQSELGDFYYQANEHDYLKSIKLLPNQTDEVEDKIAEYHKELRLVAGTEYTRKNHGYILYFIYFSNW